MAATTRRAHFRDSLYAMVGTAGSMAQMKIYPLDPPVKLPAYFIDVGDEQLAPIDEAAEVYAGTCSFAVTIWLGAGLDTARAGTFETEAARVIDAAEQAIMAGTVPATFSATAYTVTIESILPTAVTHAIEIGEPRGWAVVVGEIKYTQTQK